MPGTKSMAMYETQWQKRSTTKASFQNIRSWPQSRLVWLKIWNKQREHCWADFISELWSLNISKPRIVTLGSSTARSGWKAVLHICAAAAQDAALSEALLPELVRQVFCFLVLFLLLPLLWPPLTCYTGVWIFKVAQATIEIAFKVVEKVGHMSSLTCWSSFFLLIDFRWMQTAATTCFWRTLLMASGRCYHLHSARPNARFLASWRQSWTFSSEVVHPNHRTTVRDLLTNNWEHANR